jgi:hypothetical protein
MTIQMKHLRLAALIKSGLAALCLALLAFVLAMVAVHIPGWTRAVDKTLLHVDQFAGRGAAAMQQVQTSARISTETSQEALQRMRDLSKTLDLLNGGIIAIRGTANQATQTLAESQNTFAALAGTAESLNAQIGMLSLSARGALDSIPPTMQAGQRMFANTAELIADPVVKGAMDNVNLMTGNLSAITGDFYKVEHRYFFPEGKPNRWMRLYNGIQGASRIAQFGFYTTNMLQQRVVVSQSSEKKEANSGR